MSSSRDAGRAAHDPDQGKVGEHEAGRDVERGGRALAPGSDLLGDAARAAAELTGSLHAPPRDLRLRSGAHPQAPFLALVERPAQPAHRLEAGNQHVVEREQVFDVGRGVGPLLDAQRPPRPVGEAIALRQAHVEETLDERRERR